MDPVASFAQSYAEARGKFVAAARARGLAVASHVLPELRGADGEELATDVALVGPPDADALLVLTSATHGVEGYCGSGAQVGLLADLTTSSASVEEAGVAVLFVHAVNPHGFSLRPARQRGQRRPQPEFPRLHGAAAGQRRLCGRAPAAASGVVAAAAAERGGDRRVRGRARRARVPDGRLGRPVRLSRRICSSAAAQAAWSNRTVRSAASACTHRVAVGSPGSISTRRSARAATVKRSMPVATRPGDLARARSWWGADVTSFYDGSSTSALIAGFVTSAAYDECPARRVHRDRARVRDDSAARRCSRRCVPIIGCICIPTPRPNCARPSGGRCASRSTSMPTTGRPRCTPRRARRCEWPSRGCRRAPTDGRSAAGMRSTPRADCRAITALPSLFTRT